MTLSRRSFLWKSAGLLSIPALASQPFACSSRAPRAWYVSGRDTLDGKHQIAVFTSSGQMVSSTQVAQRVHDQAIHPLNPSLIVFFSRRPGTDAYVYSLQEQAIVATFQSGEGRTFYGHGTFSTNGDYLYTCENDYTTGQGVISVRDSSTWEKLSEFPAFGIGTHQIAMMPKGKELVVANGGIATHPDMPREKLNLDTMSPSLTYIEIESGKHLESYTPSHHQMSIRHLDVAEDGTVGIAMQYQGNAEDTVPLLAFHRGEDQLQYAQASDETWRAMKQYTASIRLSLTQNIAALTTPRGNAITFWDLETKTLVHREAMTDVAGLAYSKVDNRFICSTGLGDVFLFSKGEIRTSEAQYFSMADTKWDNHLNYVYTES